MAANTGRRSRYADPDYEREKPETTWVKRQGLTTGRLTESKKRGGAFGGVRPR